MATAAATLRRPQARPIGDRIALTQLDPVLAISALGLIGISIITLALTTKDAIPGDPFYYTVRQAMYAVVGIALMLGISRVDYSRYRELRLGIYSAMLGAIVFVLVAGTAARGSRRWIELPFFNFQPSELGKVLLVVALAGFAIDRLRHLPEGQRTLRLLALGLAPGALVFLQPDLGTGLVYGVVTLTILFIAGVRWTQLAGLGAIVASLVIAVLVVLPAVGAPVLRDYQESRLTAFLNPSDDPSDASYQTNQALIAVGSGGLTGRGDDATQARHGFLPEGRTDFIFAVVAERWGFVGAVTLLSLYALLIWRGLRILTHSKNQYGAMVAAGIVAMLLFQVFVNIGMNVGILPVTGLPLPLMSFGGSSVLVTFMAVGVLQSIYIQSRLTSEARAFDPYPR